MKTLSFLDYSIGWAAKSPLIEIDSARDGVKLKSGLHLVQAPNGLGKTTLLQTIAHRVPALRGQAVLDDRPLQAENDVHFVSEYLAFPKFVTVSEWIRFASAQAVNSADLNSWAARFRLDALLNQYLGRLSQGERRKTTWLAAHVSGRPVVLLDEPLDGLDLLAMPAARALLSEWKREGRVVIIVSHHAAEILSLSNAVWLIRDHRLVAMDLSDAERANERDFRARVAAFYGATL